MNYHFKKLLAGMVAMCSVAAVHAQADHLVLSEVLIDSATESVGNSAEFVEIFNPTPNTISLDNYYLSDSNNYTSISTTMDGMVDVGPSDTIVKFPDGTELQSGQVAVVAYTGSAFLGDFFGGNLSSYESLPGSPLLFEVVESDPQIPTMELFNSYVNPGTGDGRPDNFSKTNGGEFILMFHWDGTSDLVEDVDIVAWGLPGATSTNRFQPKDATRLGDNDTPYLVDAGDHSNLSINPATAVVVRQSINEDAELTSGGNGITGHDESTENISTNWAGLAQGQATPGVSDLVAVGSNAPPQIGATFRSVQYPTSSDSIDISASVTDVDGTIASVSAWVDTGSGFQEITATNTGGTTYTATIPAVAVSGNSVAVKYYIEAVDNEGTSSFSPALAPGEFRTFVVSDDHVLDGELVINEIMYDNPGGDTYEFVELYNNRDTAIDLSYYRFADLNFSWFVFPEGASIPAGGYVVLSLDPTLLEIQYTPVAGVEYYDWGNFVLNNGGDEIFLLHPNEFEFNGTEESYLDYVPYSATAPWPDVVPGQPIELINPDLDNSLPTSWAGAIDGFMLGSPGEENTVFSDGPIILSVSRTEEYPAPSTPIEITANLEIPDGGSVTAARIYYELNDGGMFTAVNMTVGGNAETYTGTIPGQPDGTLIRYYVEVEGSGMTSTYPVGAPEDALSFYIVEDGADFSNIVINEILYDNISSDAYEYIELYNRSSSAIDLTNVRVGDGSSAFFTFPDGAEIAGNGYIVLTLDPTALEINYTVPGGVPVYDWGDFVLNNGGDLVYVAHPNGLNFNSMTNYIDSVNYLPTAPWPEINPNSTGRSIELISPELDNSLGENWVGSVPVGDGVPGSGTPGAENTGEPSSVSNWTLY